MKWMKHYSNAQSDPKLKLVRHKYGFTGYGLYWYCLEVIAAKVDSENVSFELDDTAETISLDWGMSQKDVQEILDYFVELGLFENDNGVVTCYKLAEKVDEYTSKNPEINKINKIYKREKALRSEQKATKKVSESVPKPSGECPDSVPTVSGECPDNVPTVSDHSILDDIRSSPYQERKIITSSVLGGNPTNGAAGYSAAKSGGEF